MENNVYQTLDLWMCKEKSKQLLL